MLAALLVSRTSAIDVEPPAVIAVNLMPEPVAPALPTLASTPDVAFSAPNARPIERQKMPLPKRTGNFSIQPLALPSHPAPAAALTIAGATTAPASAGVPEPRPEAEEPARAIAGRNADPVYPTLARKRRQEGRVVLAVAIGRDGVAGVVRVVQTSGFATLDNAAIDAVRQWHFRPAIQHGAPSESEIDIPILFRLEP